MEVYSSFVSYSYQSGHYNLFKAGLGLGEDAWAHLCLLIYVCEVA